MSSASQFEAHKSPTGDREISWCEIDEGVIDSLCINLPYWASSSLSCIRPKRKQFEMEVVIELHQISA